jgi:hypothetical protein
MTQREIKLLIRAAHLVATREEGFAIKSEYDDNINKIRAICYDPCDPDEEMASVYVEAAGTSSDGRPMVLVSDADANDFNLMMEADARLLVKAMMIC